MSDDGPGKPEGEPSRRDFIAEAEEILEAFSDDLRELESDFSKGLPHRDRIHSIFRAVHSLKGFAGLLGFPDIAVLSHELEDLLSRLRLGGTLDGRILDLLHDVLDTFLELVRDLRTGMAPRRDLQSLRDRLARVVSGILLPEKAAADQIQLPETIRAALTDHEERRVRACRAEGSRLWIARVRLDAKSLGEDLEELRRGIAALGELLSAVPVAGESGIQGLPFDLLVASPQPFRAEDLPAGETIGIREITSLPAAQAESMAANLEGDSRSGEAGERFDDGIGPSSLLRVPLGRLNDLLAQSGDLAMAFGFLERGLREIHERHADDRLAGDLARRLPLIASRLRALQRGIIEARLVPLSQVFRKIGRLVARGSRASGKEIDLHTLGAETEIDRSVMDALAPALMHLVANALDHGIEAPEERERRGKERRGRVVLSAFRRGPAVIIDVIDDGRGIDLAAVRAAAEAGGLVEAGRSLTPEEACELVFRPGFSTARAVSSVSGRGVGLDVVRGAIRRLKGSILLRSVEGRGATFSITVPISLAMVPAIIVQASGQRFAIPLASIRENLRLDRGRIRASEGGEVYDRSEGSLPLFRLHGLLPHDDAGAGQGPRDAGRYAVVTEGEGWKVGLVVDSVVGRQEVVVKPVGRWLRDCPGVAGATDLGDAAAVLVLDPEALVKGGADVRTTS